MKDKEVGMGGHIIGWFTAHGVELAICAGILVVLFGVHKGLQRWMRRVLLRRHHSEENVRMVLVLLKYGFLMVGAIVILMTFSGTIAAVGISTAFLGMVLGWSLQRPVTGVAAWLALMINRPFKIGDRIIISGIRGDVVDINLMYVVLGEVGGTIGGEENSGRGVLIPTAILFDQIVYNYALESKYILDEVPVRITYESNWGEAERILLGAAREATEAIIAETGQEPFVRAEFLEGGILLRLRYQALAVERQMLSSEIVRRIYDAFMRSEEVEFCYPRSEVFYHERGPRFLRAAGGV